MGNEDWRNFTGIGSTIDPKGGVLLSGARSGDIGRLSDDPALLDKGGKRGGSASPQDGLGGFGPPSPEDDEE